MLLLNAHKLLLRSSLYTAASSVKQVELLSIIREDDDKESAVSANWTKMFPLFTRASSDFIKFKFDEKIKIKIKTLQIDLFFMVNLRLKLNLHCTTHEKNYSENVQLHLRAPSSGKTVSKIVPIIYIVII